MIRVYGVDESGRVLASPTVETAPALIKDAGATIWIDLDQPAPEDVRRIASAFHLHPLEVEDCLQDVELPKIDEFEDHIYVLTHGIHLGDDGEIAKVELDSFLGKRWLITSHLKHSRSCAQMRERVERQPEILARGADFLLHAILDFQVDNYMPIVDRFDAEIERIEEEILERPRPALIGEVLSLRRQVVHVRRSIVPQRDVLGRLARRDSEFVTAKCSVYFRDIYDHVVRAHDMLEGIRDVVSGLAESYRSVISQRLNEVMQRLTLISTTFLPMTFVASIYGMNFNPEASPLNMPELGWRFGYPMALALMMLVGGGFYVFFKKKKWV